MIVYNIGHNIVDTEDNVYCRVKGETLVGQPSRLPGEGRIVQASVNREKTRKTE